MTRNQAQMIISNPGRFSVADVRAACSFIIANPNNGSVDDTSWQNRAFVCRWAHATA